MSKSLNRRDPDCIAVPAPEVAKLLGVSVRHVWALLAQERLPRPIRLGRSVRWNVDELRAWLDAGAPVRDTWERMRVTTMAPPQQNGGCRDV